MFSVLGGECVWLCSSELKGKALQQRMFSEVRTSSESHLTKSGYQRMLNVYASLLQVWNPASTACSRLGSLQKSENQGSNLKLRKKKFLALLDP